MNQELTYWVALTHTPKIWTSRKNEMIVHCFKQEKTIIDFFESSNFLNMELKQEEKTLLNQTKSELANFSFMVEELLNQGVDVIPIISKDYSPILKTNLKYNAPLVLYTKGNKKILQEQSIAIVGSRNANENSLIFTENVAKKASLEYKVVVSGFAKGVDKQALDSAIKYKGQSIIVLPQGITTFSSGIKKYYKQIIEGDVLVLSTFHPKLPWSVDLAMARNSTIYGLASEIYAAQSDEKGGTWSGVCEGLKKGRKVFVRVPEKKENCANLQLIKKGATAVNINGDPVENDMCVIKEELPSSVAEPLADYGIVKQITRILEKGGEYTIKQIMDKLQTNLSSKKIQNILEKIDGVKIKKGRQKKYMIDKCEIKQLSLFSE
ncbi:MAG: DNA-protecting protein DprA [Paludibacteraceae bacterium]|nr:DNA-protecting protein DprA [Paludibacteraceae bacterium]